MIYHDLPFEQYLKISALSSTAFKDFITSPTLYKWNKDHPREASKAQEFGTTVHGFVLERPTFYDEFIALEPEMISMVNKFRANPIDFRKVHVTEKVSRNSKAYKELVKSLPSDTVIMWPDEYDKAYLLYELDASIDNKMMITKELERDLLELGFEMEGNNEVSVEFEYKDVKCKARFDSYTDDGLIRDLKTTANPYGFDREITKWKYWLQAAFYSIAFEQVFGKKPRGFEFVVVPNKQPYSDISIHKMHPLYIEHGIDVINKHIENFKYCQDNDDFKREPQYSEVYKPDYLVM